MFDVHRMGLVDVVKCSSELRTIGKRARSMEGVATELVSYFYERMHDAENGRRAMALVRFYKTHALAELEPDVRRFVVDTFVDQPLAHTTPCLTLLGTVGDEKAWCSRHASRGHKAIPLASEQSVERLPMIAHLVRQLGLDVSYLLKPDARLIVDLDQRTFNVFHVEHALGSPHIPAQREFVEPYEIKSVLGFGGVLPSGELFATIMFSRVTIDPNVAHLVKPLTLSVKLALLPFVGRTIFQQAGSAS
jgi:hypothetical protein